MSANGSRGTEATFDAYAPFEPCDIANRQLDQEGTRRHQRRRDTVVTGEAITLRFPDGSWEYCTTEGVPDARDSLVRAGVTWVVVGVTEALDDHRVVTLAAPAPEVLLPSVARRKGT